MPRNGMPTVAAVKPESWEERFRYGWRYVHRVGPNGKEILEEVPLTLADVLHPQEDDVIPENTLQLRDRGYLYDVLNTRRTGLRHPRVFSDCLIDWGVPGLGDHSPDISVFENVADQERHWGTFPAREQGADPLLAIELVSPHTRKNDAVIKVQHYHRARVPVYIVVDQKTEDGPRTLIGYRWTAQRYVRMRPDRQGRLLLKRFGIRIGLVDNRVVCYDAETDEPIGDYTQLTQALQTEAAARQAAEDRVRALEEELRRLRGDAK
jgi:colicin import membrane protein